MGPRSLTTCLALAGVMLSARASAAHPDGAALVRLLGSRAQQALAPRGSPGIGALVTLPAGVRATDLGLTPAAPGIARLWGSPAHILAFSDAHPGLPIEVSPPLHPLLDSARVFVTASLANDTGMDGTGVLVGIADTGLDVTHKDFIDDNGHTRVAWLLDLSSPPRGVYPDLEQKYGTTDDSGNLVAGAVWAAADIDALLSTGQGASLAQLPQDEAGHGTLVASCAAGNGLQGSSQYRGVAPKATILAARVTGVGSEEIGNDELLRGTAFLFERADFMQKPVVVNLSIGTQFGPHDGTTSWEQALASHVGPGLPGHALVVAAGNDGSIVGGPVHQSVFVAPGSTVRVPLTAPYAAQNGGAEVWVAVHGGASVSVGLDSPEGTWISPVRPGDSAGKNTSAFTAAVYNGSQPSNSPVPAGSDGAVVVWQGQWPAGTYAVTLTGRGSVDLYVEGTGDQAGAGAVGWVSGVREGTVTLPASHPEIIGVGCTINKTSWHAMAGYALGLSVPELDAVGGAPAADGGSRDPLPGEPCWFSSAGPTLTGVQKPDIMAPGAAIVGAMSQQAVPPATNSIFTNPSCPDKTGSGANPDCQQVDPEHAVSFGTSFSSPLVAGTVAILLQRDPTLTQDQVLAALQGGVHPLRAPSEFEDQRGPGEVDVVGALTALDRARNPQLALPVASRSWLVLGADVYLADSSTPLEAILELRGDPVGDEEPPPADGFEDGRLAVRALVDGVELAGAVTSLVRRGPGVWVAEVMLPAGLGGSNLIIDATFDGTAVVGSRSIPIATDAWNADYPPGIEGGCVTSRGRATGWGAVLMLGLAVVWSRRARRRIE
ncbi:MAG: S8 family serine peptidase [Polyangiaceae bacterium]